MRTCNKKKRGVKINWEMDAVAEHLSEIYLFTTLKSNWSILQKKIKKNTESIPNDSKSL